MIRVFDHLRNHGLNDSNITVQSTSHDSGRQANPIVLSKAEDQTGQGSASKTNQDYGLPAIAVADTSPHDTGGGLCKSKGRDQQAGEERGIRFVISSQVECKNIDVCQNRGEGNWLGKAAQCCQES